MILLSQLQRLVYQSMNPNLGNYSDEEQDDLWSKIHDLAYEEAQEHGDIDSDKMVGLIEHQITKAIERGTLELPFGMEPWHTK